MIRLKIFSLLILCLFICSECQPRKQAMETAQNQYIQYCGACHGRNVEYLKQKDESEWMYPKTYDAIYKAIKEGVPDKNMPPYEETLSPEEIKNMTKFILKKLKQ